MISNRTLYEIVIAVWVIIAVIYCIRTPYQERACDIWGHIEYTEKIVKEHRMPKPFEFRESTQNPLYYLINSSVVPASMQTDKLNHINYVRTLSVLYGAIALVIIAWLLGKFTSDNNSKLLILLFILTTPKFIFIFSTYNNDSLVNLLSISVIALSYKLYYKWSWWFSTLLFLISIAAIYTKTTFLSCIFVISILCFFSLLLKSQRKSAVGIFIILMASLILFFPWMYFHNYKSVNNFLPTDMHMYGKIYLKPDLKNFSASVKSFLKIPVFQQTPHEWEDPWVHAEPDHPGTKTYDYFSYVFINSIIGECESRKPDVSLYWILLWVSLLIVLIALAAIFASPLTKLAGAFLLLTHFVHVIYLGNITIPVWGACMNYRYIAWSLVGWSVLYLSVLIGKNKVLSSLMQFLFVIAIVLHTYVLLTIEGGNWW